MSRLKNASRPWSMSDLSFTEMKLPAASLGRQASTSFQDLVEARCPVKLLQPSPQARPLGRGMETIPLLEDGSFSYVKSFILANNLMIWKQRN